MQVSTLLRFRSTFRMKSADIVLCVRHMACLWLVCRRMTCLLDLAAKAAGCRPHARLHKCVVTRCFLCGSQRLEKKSTNHARLMSRSVYRWCLRTTSAQIPSKGHSCHVALLTGSPDISLRLFLLQSQSVDFHSGYFLSLSVLTHFADCVLFCFSSERTAFKICMEI